jgi:hypothetical protein
MGNIRIIIKNKIGTLNAWRQFRDRMFGTFGTLARPAIAYCAQLGLHGRFVSPNGGQIAQNMGSIKPASGGEHLPCPALMRSNWDKRWIPKPCAHPCLENRYPLFPDMRQLELFWREDC